MVLHFLMAVVGVVALVQADEVLERLTLVVDSPQRTAPPRWFRTLFRVGILAFVLYELRLSFVWV